MLACSKVNNILLAHSSKTTARLLNSSLARFSSSRGDEFDGSSSNSPELKIIFDSNAEHDSPEMKHLAKLDLLFDEEIDALGTKRYKNFPFSGHVNAIIEIKKFMVPAHSQTYSAVSQFQKTNLGMSEKQQQIDTVKHFGALNRIRNCSLLKMKRKQNGEKPLSFLDRVQCDAYECPDLLKRDFMYSFPQLQMQPFERLTVISVTENDTSDMNNNGDIIHNNEEHSFKASLAEKSSKNTVFAYAAEEICNLLQASGYWADFVDPVTGKLFSGEASTDWTNSDAKRSLDRFESVSVKSIGNCKVINQQKIVQNLEQSCSGPEMGVVFTTASADSPVVQCIVNHAPSTTNKKDSAVPFDKSENARVGLVATPATPTKKEALLTLNDVL